ncbi:MAG TPA: gamma-glutamyl-gamma-aminobutyrate hydrolase family protein [Candidatus Saccharimonadales bacterium]|nr:gamma-glutamyl-gamma-aminobutyrate hydrolase family protein [Candidatus Saccharimonadales bacterium]
MTMQSRVAVLDAGGQYVDLVRKAVERQGIPADILPLDTKLAKITGKYGAIIISGSPASSHEETAPLPDISIWASDLPLLGICYGMQAMVVAHGGQVAKNSIREDGRIITNVDTTHPLFNGIKKDFRGLFTHGDFVVSIPADFEMLGSHILSDGSIAYSAVGFGNKLGVQFHPEVFDDTPEGYQVFKNFLSLIAHLQPDQKFQDHIFKELISNKQKLITNQAGDKPVIAFVSGGVDSTVAVTLASKVIPNEKLHSFYIDNGFMRDEDDMVLETLTSAGISVNKIDAVEDFENATVKFDGEVFGPLVDITDPELKRKIIGKGFIDVQNSIISKLKLTDALLLQGTNAADRIESGHSTGDRHTMTIKTHHNQVQEVQDLKATGQLIEPLDDLFKDEIRFLGKELGLPEILVQRQPFPGPGLAIRIIGSTKPDSDTAFVSQEKAIQTYLDSQLPGVKVHLLPIRSVGVGGDERSHLSVAAIENSKLNADELAKLGTELPAHFRSTVNRVIYALDSKPLSKPSITKTQLTADVRTQLRHADRLVFDAMRTYNILDNIKQFPVIIIPLAFGKSGKRSIVLRPVTTSTFMTVQAMLPGRDLPNDFLNNLSEKILLDVEGISQVFLDLTNKPPATTEWE